VLGPAQHLRVRAAAKMLRGTKHMRVTSKAGSDLSVDMVGASTVGVWGWTDKPGTLAHWPGGIVVSFPKSGTINGTLVMAPGDINLTFKRYLGSPVKMTLKDDYVVNLEGEGADAAMMRTYLAAWGDREAYAVSHVGFGMLIGNDEDAGTRLQDFRRLGRMHQSFDRAVDHKTCLLQRSDNGPEPLDRFARTRRTHRNDVTIARCQQNDMERSRAHAEQRQFGEMNVQFPGLRLRQNSGRVTGLNRAAFKDLAERVDPFCLDAIGQHACPPIGSCQPSGKTRSR